MCYDISMSNLSKDISDLKQKYREIFLHAGDFIKRQVEQLKPQGLCKSCSSVCKKERVDVFDAFPKGCGYKNWQKEVLEKFEHENSKEIYEKWMKILEYRKYFSCVGCATCCKLACSEFSPEELAQKAQNGDSFATQFLSVFVPYASEEQARAIYPEYFELLEEKLGKNEKVYFYHCPKLTDDNRCSDYENRPQICRDFPDNPLSMLPKSCGYSEWKDEVEPTALKLHAMLEVIAFYKDKIVI